MIGIPKTGTLEHGFISANVTSGYVCIAVIKNFKIGQGHIVVHSAPPGLAKRKAPKLNRV